MIRTSLILAAVVMAALMAAPAGADVTNGGFEAGLTGWTSSGTASATTFEMARDFLAPVGADWTPRAGQFFASLWSTDSAGANASSLSQTFAANAGDTLRFDYFYDYGDLAPDLDAAWATLSWGANVVTLFEYNTPGNQLSDDENVGWAAIAQLLPTTDTYTLEFHVRDGASGMFESILGVDKVSVSSQVIPAPGAAALLVIGMTIAGVVRRRVR